MSRTSPRFTRRDYEMLPEGFPAQLVDGWLVKEPSPLYPHQRVGMRVVERLLPLVGVERLITAPTDVFLDDFNVYQPDVAVFRRPLAARRRHVPLPLVVFEVLSTSTAGRDRTRKTRGYLRSGVREVWLVDPDTGAVEVRTAEGSRSFGPDDVAESLAIPGFAVTGRELMR